MLKPKLLFYDVIMEIKHIIDINANPINPIYEPIQTSFLSLIMVNNSIKDSETNIIPKNNIKFIFILYH